MHSSGVFTVHAHIYCVAFVKLPHITCILCGKTSKRATPEFKLYRKLLQHVVYRISRDDDNGFLYRLLTLQVDPLECSIHALLKNNIYAIYMLRIKRKILYIFFLSRSFPKSSPLRSFFYLYQCTNGVHTEGLIIIALKFTLKCRPRRFFIYVLVCRPFFLLIFLHKTLHLPPTAVGALDCSPTHLSYSAVHVTVF